MNIPNNAIENIISRVNTVTQKQIQQTPYKQLLNVRTQPDPGNNAIPDNPDRIEQARVSRQNDTEQKLSDENQAYQADTRQNPESVVSQTGSTKPAERETRAENKTPVTQTGQSPSEITTPMNIPEQYQPYENKGRLVDLFV